MKAIRTFVSTLATIESNTQKVALFIYILLLFFFLLFAFFPLLVSPAVPALLSVDTAKWVLWILILYLEHWSSFGAYKNLNLNIGSLFRKDFFFLMLSPYLLDPRINYNSNLSTTYKHFS